MKNVARMFLLVATAVVSIGEASAATVSVLPATTTVTPGGSVSIDLFIDGLGDTSAPALGDFDIDITFDAGALTLTGYTLGGALGDPGTGEALDVSFGEYLVGTLNIAEVSLLTPGELEGSQPAGFVLATIEFTATGLAAGDSTSLDIGAVFALGDATGSPVVLDTTSGATITAVVPAPAAVWLFATALLAAAGMRRPPV